MQHQNILAARTGASSKSYLRNYALLSNDNAFLSYYPNQFTQRTLLARFQINTTSSRLALTSSGTVNALKDNTWDGISNMKQKFVTFVRKPAYILMGMLTLLGEKQIHLNISSRWRINLLSVRFSIFEILPNPFTLKTF